MNIHPELLQKLLQLQIFFKEQWSVLPLYSYPQSSTRNSGSLADLIEDDDTEDSSYYGGGGTARGNRGDNTKRAQRRAKSAGR